MTAFAPLVDSNWLQDNFKSQDLLILDATWYMPNDPRNATQEFQQQRIPGAQFFDFDTVFCDPTSSLPHMLPSAERFEQLAQQMGICSHHHIVVYDNLGIFSSPRVWWMFKSMGHNKVAVLNGGLPSWLHHGGLLETGAPNALDPGDFQSHLNEQWIKSSHQILEATQQNTATVVDARPSERFHAKIQEPRPNLRSGHIPGSLNLPFTQLYRHKSENDIIMLDPLEMQKALEQLGINDMNQAIIFTCGSGVTACTLALAAEHLGYNNLSVYDGSWSEWGENHTLPIATE